MENQTNSTLKVVPTTAPVAALAFKPISPVNAKKKPKIFIPTILKGFKTGIVGVLAGTGGIGKSTLLLGIVYGLADKRADVFNLSTSEKPLKVLFMSAEDDEAVVNNRMHDFAVHHKLPDEVLEQVEAQACITCERLSMKKITDKAWLTALKLYCIQNTIDLVIFDTYSIFSGVQNENDNSEATAVIDALYKDLIADTQLSVLLVHHTNSEGNIRGAKALRENTRVTYVIRKPEDEEIEKIEAAGFDSTKYANLGIIKTNYDQLGSMCWLKMTKNGIFELAELDMVIAVNQKSESAKSGHKKSKGMQNVKNI